MQYDPIKKRLGTLSGNSIPARRTLYTLLDILLLRSWHVRRMIRNTAPSLPANAIILDAGAGFGQYSWRLARMNRHWHIEAVDMKEEQVNDCNSFFTAAGMNHRVTFHTGDLTRLTEENKYDMILCVDVLEHITDDILVMNNFARALKKNGVLIVSTPSDQGGSGVHDHHGESFIDEHVRNGYNITQLTASLSESGFSDVSAAYTYGWPGSMAWHLSMKYPVSMLNHSSLFWLLLPFYYLLVMPFTLILNTFDLLCRHDSGTGLIVKAIK